MNTIAEIKRINSKQLELGADTGSWHDQYKDSAYIYVGGLPFQLTEGDIITIFSQYGEIVDISLPRDPTTQKPRGFAFLMYADQRSTILAVDNLGGAKVLDRTLRVDHVLNYKQLEKDQETGKMKEREAPSFAAHPERFLKQTKSDNEDEADSDSSHPSIDPDDPMRDYLIEQRRAASKGKPKKRKYDGETKEERRKRKEEKRRSKEERARKKLGNFADERKRIDQSASSKRGYHDDDRPRERDDGARRRGDYDRRDRDRGYDRNRREADGDDYDRRRRDDREDNNRDRRRRYDDDADEDRNKRRRDTEDPSTSTNLRSSAFADLERAVGLR